MTVCQPTHWNRCLVPRLCEGPSLGTLSAYLILPAPERLSRYLEGGLYKYSVTLHIMPDHRPIKNHTRITSLESPVSNPKPSSLRWLFQSHPTTFNTLCRTPFLNQRIPSSPSLSHPPPQNIPFKSAASNAPTHKQTNLTALRVFGCTQTKNQHKRNTVTCHGAEIIYYR